MRGNESNLEDHLDVESPNLGASSLLGDNITDARNR